jgi:charged multivesicular body protein 2A
MGAGLSLDKQIKNDVKMMDRHERIIERDVTRMTREQQTVTIRLKAYAKRGDTDMVNEMANQYAVYRMNIKKLSKLKSHTSNVKQQIQMMRSIQEINRALSTLTTTMKQINSTTGVASLGSIIREYDREIARTETNVEMLDEAMTDDNIDEDEQRELVNSVLDEIGVEIDASMMSAPFKTSDADSEVEKILEHRLKSLLI